MSDHREGARAAAIETAAERLRDVQGSRPGPAEQARLRAGFGLLVATERRTGAGITQRELARRAGVSQPTIAAAELGTRRPSETTTRLLAVALRPEGAPVDVAELDLRLQAAAGESLRRWRHRRPRSARWTRVYAAAAERLAAEPVPTPALDVAAGRLLAALDEAAGR